MNSMKGDRDFFTQKFSILVTSANHTVPPSCGLSRRGAVTFEWIVLAGLLTILLGWPVSSVAFDWVPTDEELQKYRKSWNPFSHGPILLQAVDIQPKGQFSLREFLFTQIGERSFDNQLELAPGKPGPVHLYSIAPSLNATYGITNHLELGAATGFNAFWATSNGKETSDSGMGDTSFILKYRPIVQDPETRRPSLTLFSQIVLPTSRWVSGTDRPPGGFSPLGRLPNTRFGELGFTGGIMVRKNLQPFRISSAVFYTYSAPGEGPANMTTYTGDVVNTRFIVEHLLDDKRGLGYNIEVSTLHGLTWRADGHSINAGQRSGFTVIGVEPALQWRFWDNWVAAAGVLFTVAGQNASDSFYPNISLFWYWSKTGKVIMR